MLRPVSCRGALEGVGVRSIWEVSVFSQQTCIKAFRVRHRFRLFISLQSFSNRESFCTFPYLSICGEPIFDKEI